MFWVVVATVSANCEPWCSEPCTVLNGNVQVECGGCDVRGSGCFPGAQGYDDWAERNAAFHNGRELGGLSPATPVDDPESLLAPSCTTLRCKRVRQKRRIERQRAEEQAVLEAQTKRAALGGPSKPSRRPSRRESARRAPESDVKFGQPRHDGRSAGGVDVPCELQRIGYDEILSFTPDQRRALFEKPTIVTGLIDEWPALRNWTDPRRFAARFGHHRFLAKRVRFGIERAATMGIAYERMQHSVSVAELVQHTESEHIIVLDEWGKGRSEELLLQDLLQEYSNPEIFEGASQARVFSFGGGHRGVQASTPHRHLIPSPNPNPNPGPGPGP